MSVEKLGLVIHADSGTGILHKLTGVIAGHQGNIGSVAIMQESEQGAYIFFEVLTPEPEELVADLEKLTIVRAVERVKTTAGHVLKGVEVNVTDWDPAGEPDNAPVAWPLRSTVSWPL